MEIEVIPLAVKRKLAEYKDYGKMKIKINAVMDSENVTVYELSKETGLKHQTVKAYYNNEPLTKVDMDVLAKMCYVLDCNIDDVLEYEPPAKEEN